VRAPLVVIGKIAAEDLLEMTLVENNNVIQTLSSNAIDDALKLNDPELVLAAVEAYVRAKG